jgi:hypothetical protein
VGTAAPVCDATGVVGSLTVTIPEVRFQPGMGSRIPRLVMRSAGQISEVLGHRGSPAAGLSSRFRAQGEWVTRNAGCPLCRAHCRHRQVMPFTCGSGEL